MVLVERIQHILPRILVTIALAGTVAAATHDATVAGAAPAGVYGHIVCGPCGRDGHAPVAGLISGTARILGIPYGLPSHKISPDGCLDRWHQGICW